MRVRNGPRSGWLRWWGVFWLALASVFSGWAQGTAGGFASALLFDETTKEMRGPAGSTNFVFTFAFTNAAPGQVVIESVRTSCGCTVAKVPALPWTIPPGGDGEFSVVLDARGKRGTVTKAVYVNTSMGLKPLTVRAIIEGSEGSMTASEDRLRNMQIALADRGAVFRGDCATCHAKPAEGKVGPALYLAACGVCHDSHIRASMVPDLKNLPHRTDRDHWLRWITFGRHGSLMPAFAQSEGGILTDAQIDSLADYLTRTISQRNFVQVTPRPPAPAPGSPAVQRGVYAPLAPTAPASSVRVVRPTPITVPGAAPGQPVAKPTPTPPPLPVIPPKISGQPDGGPVVP